MTRTERTTIIKENENGFKDIFNNNASAYAILQLPIEVPYKFRGLRDIKEITGQEPNRNDYNVLYAEGLDWEGEITEKQFLEIGEALFTQFNIGERPDNYYGTSMSVSDVVIIKINGTIKALYVDNFGFKVLENFAV